MGNRKRRDDYATFSPSRSRWLYGRTTQELEAEEHFGGNRASEPLVRSEDDVVRQGLFESALEIFDREWHAQES